MSVARPVEHCPDCDVPGGYCAPLRCYCGHPACPSFDSHVPRPGRSPS